MKDERIVKVFEVVKPDESLKEKIMSTIQSDEEMHRYRQAGMRKNFVRMIRNVAAILMVVLISSVSIYGSGPKGLEEFFEDELRSVAVANLLEQPQKKTWIGDYCIILKEYLMEQDTRQMYMVLEVKKKNGTIEFEKKEEHPLCFGKDGRFRIGTEGAVAEVWGKMSNERLYLYVHVDATVSDKDLDKVVFVEDTDNLIRDTGDRYMGFYKRYYFDIE